MRSLRFVHCADIHLDSPLRGLAGQEGSAVSLIRSATREAFDRLIGRTIEEEAAFLVIAGDLYDGNWRDYQTGLFFVRQMARLKDAGIDAYLIYGNHDAESKITRSLALPENVRVFPPRKPATFEIRDLGIALHGQSFRQPAVTENLARSYPAPIDGALNIGLLHTALSGADGHQNYAPCSLDELVQKGYDYWALGHVHEPSIRHRRPFVVYSGVLQGRHIRETGPKGAYMVSVDDGAISDVASLEVDLVRWAVVDVPLQNCTSLEDLYDAIRTRIEQAVAQHADGRLLACRIVLRGSTAVHGAALGSEEKLLAEARSAAEGLGEEKAWIERLVVRTDPLPSEDDRTALEDAFGRIDDAKDDESMLSLLREDIGALIAKLPHEVRKDTDDELLRAAADGNYNRLIDLAGPYAMARLTEGQD